MSRTIVTASAVTTSPLPTVTDHPYRFDNPFFQPDGPLLLDSIRTGRIKCQNYVMILLITLLMCGIVHWVSKAYSWRQIHAQLSTENSESDGKDEEQELLGSKPRRYGFWVRQMHKLDSFLMYQPEGDDAEHWAMTIFISVYIVLTIVYSLIDTFHHPILLAFRLGMISTCNLVFLYILGAKYSPLTWLIGWSYEQLNILHRWCGAFCVIAIMIHSSLFLYFFRFAYIVTHLWTFMGLVGGICFFAIGISSVKNMRLLAYELFYAIHLVGSVITIPALYFHYPTAKWYAVGAGVSFLYDRVVRLLMGYRLVRIDMTVHAGDTVIMRIPQNTGVGLNRPYSYEPGQHVFITVFGCGTFESHPFTVVSNPNVSKTLDIIVRARDGFSRRFLDKCTSSSTDVTSMRGLMHGPYGIASEVFENAEEPTRIILASGGAGVAFTYPLYLQYKHFVKNPNVSVKFLWVVPWRDFCDWIEVDDEMHIWITREQGRPNIEELVRDMAEDYSTNCHVYTCGPEPLIRSIRNTVSSLRNEGKMIEYHAERFGW